MTFIPLTYFELLENQNRSVTLGDLKAQTAANRATALRLFLRANHLQEGDVVGSEMRSQYPISIEIMINMLRVLGRTERSISNTRAALTGFRKSVADDDDVRAISDSLDTPFTAELKKILQGLKINTVARQSGVPRDMLCGWLRGKKPRLKSIVPMRRLERFFGLARDSIVLLSGLSTKSGSDKDENQASPIAYRECLNIRNKERYFLIASDDSILRPQWVDLIRYKTQPVPSLLRSPSGRWTASQLNVKRQTASTWWAFLDDKEIPTARTTWTRVAGYLGWLTLSKEKGGAGLPYSETETLAWLAVPGYVEAYVEWMKVRAGEKHTGGIFQFFALIAWMLKPIEGYLYQLPTLKFSLPIHLHSKNWETMCEEQHTFCRRLKQALLQEQQIGRDAFEPLNHILQMKEPLEAVADMVQRMRRDRPVGSVVREAIWARDIFLIKMLVTNPLRLRNVASLTWSPLNINGHKPSDRCALYQRVDGSWWISVPKIFLKNRRGPSIYGYDSPIRQNVWDDLERYLIKHRPSLLRTSTDLVFLSYSKSVEKSVNEEHGIDDVKFIIKPHFPFMDLTRRVFLLTKKYLWKCDGIGTHAFRHIVATAILKTNDGNVKTAALVLNDSEATVAKHYSGMRSGDGAVRMGELLGATLDKM